ncbi:MAG: hypothetical protein KF704_12310 [Crocinitomicaceae bacterium]|nr:hypothetical protein [Crocinitomicaceae bacterium]
MLNYEDRKKSINKQIELISELNHLNKKLFVSNQIFLHPYCQGFEIEHIQNLIKESDDPDNAVLTFFGRKFFNLKTNLSILHGYCGKQPYLKEYINTITRSLSLCIQYEYQGAISVLIPVIEGTLRKYMVDKLGEKNVSITSMQELLKAIKIMRSDHLKLLRAAYEKDFSKNGKSVDQNKVKNLLKLDGENFDLWSEQFEIFIRDYLFRYTRNTDVIDDLNRHIITHRFKDKIDFSFKNYLRVYHSLFHLSWLINCSQPNGSPFSDPDENLVFNEYITLLNLLMLSESSRFVKERLYGEKINSFNTFLTDEYRYAIGRSGKEIEKILMRLHIDADGKEKQP